MGLLTYEWDALRGRHALGHQQLKHGEGQQHRDTQGDFFTRVSRQVESQWSQKGDHHAGNEEVEDVEGGASFEVEGECDVRVRIRAASIQDDVLLGWHAQNLDR